MRQLCRSILLIFAVLSEISADDQTLPPAAAETIDFERQILPIFQNKCFDCHGAETQESQFRLDRKSALLRGGNSGEPAIVVGKSAESHLIQLVAEREKGKVMPPEGSGRLSDEEIGLLRAWIDQGANWPGPNGVVTTEKLTTDHWSFQPVQAVIPPAIDDAWIRNDIDRFLLHAQREHGLMHQPDAERAVLIRRLWFDMLGLPPTPEEVAAFENDPDPLAYERLVERALASPHYGERWARYWLDLVRFAETHGFETNRERPNAWPYRDYVIASLNGDKPYDQFIREQLAGDALDAPIGTAYLVAGPYDLVKSPDINLTLMQRQNELDDIINTTATTFLGLTLGCARCHNHKFDPITQRDYYAWQAIFAGVQHGERALPPTPAQREALARIEEDVAALESRLEPFRVRPQTGRYLVFDDDPERSGRAVEFVKSPSGRGANPDGVERGFRRDPGDALRSPNVSGGEYSWWKHAPGEVVCVWRPGLTGAHRVWLSWGCGFETHTRDAQYVLDRDGDLQTGDDRQVVAVIDQQQFAGVRGDLAGKPLWSGFHNAGVVEFDGDTALLLVGGETGTAVTSDVIAFERLDSDNLDAARVSEQPRFGPPVNALHNVERFEPVAARWIRFRVLATNSGEPCLDELEVFSGDENVALASGGATAACSSALPGYEIHKLEHIHDGRYGNGRSWISNEPGRGWVQIELPEPRLIDRIEWARDREGKFADRIPIDYVVEVATELDRWRRISGSADRLPFGSPANAEPVYRFESLTPEQAERGRADLAALEALEKRRETLRAAPTVYAGTFSQPGPTHRLFRGEPQAQREQVGPDTLEVLGSLGLPTDVPEQDRRQALADWIAAPGNPLTARVIVNRLWQFHFGRGLVDTPSDFGAGGVPPSHPELLDWLAGELMRNGWSLKHMHRLMLTSAAYRQSNRPVAENLRIDAANVYLWRFEPRRLEAEPIRDAILSVSGALDTRAEGPGFSAFEVELENVRHYHPKSSFGPEDWRRMIYMTKVRQEQDAVFGPLDCPDASTAVAKRSRSTTPLQALNLFNSTFMLQQSELFARRLEAERPGDRTSQIALAYRLCFARGPSSEELAEALEFVGAAGLPAFCRAMLNSNEFLFLP